MKDSFKFLNEEDLRRLTKGAQRVTFQRDQEIVEEGTRHQAIFVLRRGTVRVEKNYLAGRVPISRLSPGEIFHEMSFLENAGASASVVADEEVELDIIGAAHLNSLLETDTGFSSRFYHSLAVTLSARLRGVDTFVLPPYSWG